MTYYQAFVADGHTDYHGENHHVVTVPAKYDPIPIADTPKIEHFKTELLAHQQGKTDYLIFIQMCAATGIEKWEIRMEKMSCTYFDKEGKEILEEAIPH